MQYPAGRSTTCRSRRKENQSPARGWHEAHERRETAVRSAGFQTCCIADFPICRPRKNPALGIVQRPAGLETRDTADSEVCATFQPAVHWQSLTLFANIVSLPTNGKASRTAPSPQPSPSEREREKTPPRSSAFMPALPGPPILLTSSPTRFVGRQPAP